MPNHQQLSILRQLTAEHRDSEAEQAGSSVKPGAGGPRSRAAPMTWADLLHLARRAAPLAPHRILQRAAVPASGLIGPAGRDLCPSICASREQMLKVSSVPCPRRGFYAARGWHASE